VAFLTTECPFLAGIPPFALTGRTLLTGRAFLATRALLGGPFHLERARLGAPWGTPAITTSAALCTLRGRRGRAQTLGGHRDDESEIAAGRLVTGGLHAGNGTHRPARRTGRWPARHADLRAWRKVRASAGCPRLTPRCRPALRQARAMLSQPI
jgi:hypothetical protein